MSMLPVSEIPSMAELATMTRWTSRPIVIYAWRLMFNTCRETRSSIPGFGFGLGLNTKYECRCLFVRGSREVRAAVAANISRESERVARLGTRRLEGSRLERLRLEVLFTRRPPSRPGVFRPNCPIVDWPPDETRAAITRSLDNRRIR